MIFITFEGCEGADKAALIDAVQTNLFNRDYSVLRGRLPNFAFNLTKSSVFDDPLTTKRFWKTTKRQFADIPERTILLQDRWAESTYVYQGLVGAASDGELRDAIYRRARQMTAPDLTIYLRVSPQIAAERIAERDGATPNIERLSKVVDAYDRLYRDSCSKFSYIAQIWSPSHVSGIWEQPVYRPLARAQFDEVVETVANLIIDKWKEKY